MYLFIYVFVSKYGRKIQNNPQLLHCIGHIGDQTTSPRTPLGPRIELLMRHFPPIFFDDDDHDHDDHDNDHDHDDQHNNKNDDDD